MILRAAARTIRAARGFLNRMNATRPRRRSREAGFTLIEVMVAAVILILVMYGLMQFYFRGRKHVDYEEHRRKATATAQARLDQARTWSYSYLEALEAGSGSDTTLNVDGRAYAVSLDVFPGGNEHYKRLRAVVSWDAEIEYGGASVTRTDTVTTHVGRLFGSPPS